MGKRKIEGSITVFLSLIFTVYLSLVFSLIYSSIVSGKRVMAEAYSNICIDSVFAQYSRELLEKYGLFYIDTATVNKGSIESGMKYMLDKCFEDNFTDDINNAALRKKNLINPGMPESRIVSCSLLTDEKGKVFRQQAINYIEQCYAQEILAKIVEEALDSADYNLGEDGLSQQLSDSSSEFEGYVQDAVESGEEENSETALIDNSFLFRNAVLKAPYINIKIAEGGEEAESVDIKNPVDGVSRLFSRGLTEKVFDKDISDKEIDLTEAVYKRDLDEGEGVVTDYGYDGIRKKIYFNEYIVSKFPNANDVSDEVLDYGVEYIICGKKSDKKNLNSVIRKLMAMRTSANMAYILSDSTKKREAAAVAAIVAAGFLLPAAYEPVKYIILFVWSFIESICDIRNLFKGNKVPIVKTAEDWSTSKEALLKYIQDDELDVRGKRLQKGLSYKGYLRILLSFTGEEKKTMRAINLIEQNVRKVNPLFKADYCVEWSQFELTFVNDRNYLYRREFGYIQ